MNISGITAQSKDSVSIQKTQIKNIYIGLKTGEVYRNYYDECLQASKELNQIIISQDLQLQKSVQKITDLNLNNEKLNGKITDSEVEIQRLKNKKIPWYKHPILYLLLGFSGGIYLMK